MERRFQATDIHKRFVYIRPGRPKFGHYLQVQSISTDGCYAYVMFDGDTITLTVEHCNVEPTFTEPYFAGNQTVTEERTDPTMKHLFRVTIVQRDKDGNVESVLFSDLVIAATTESAKLTAFAKIAGANPDVSNVGISVTKIELTS